MEKKDTHWGGGGGGQLGILPRPPLAYCANFGGPPLPRYVKCVDPPLCRYTVLDPPVKVTEIYYKICFTWNTSTAYTICQCFAFHR